MCCVRLRSIAATPGPSIEMSERVPKRGGRSGSEPAPVSVRDRGTSIVEVGDGVYTQLYRTSNGTYYWKDVSGHRHYLTGYTR